MRKHKYSRFKSLWQETDRHSIGFYLLLPFTVPIWLFKLALIGVMAVVIVLLVAVMPSALRMVERAVREAEASGQSESGSTRLKGGEARQGSERKGSLVRPGGPLSSDDLRRRLYELRSSKSERKIRRSLIEGGQNGE